MRTKGHRQDRQRPHRSVHGASRVIGQVLGFGCALAGSAALTLPLGCSSSNSIQGGGDAGAGSTCANPPAVTGDAFCKSCTPASQASPAQCTAARTVDACCTWVQAPKVELARGTGLHYFSDTDPTVNLGCLTAPATLGTPKAVTLSGHVKLFSHGGDSAGVKIEIFKEGASGALGDLVGQAFITTTNDTTDPAQVVTWLNACPTPDGCKFRSFTYPNVPTETPLIIKTSDAAAGNTWAEFYDYNVYFANGTIDTAQEVHYDPSAVAATDIATVAATVGITIKDGQGLLAGEVHDCGDVRLAGATVDTDLAHEGPLSYFTDNESNPLPDQGRAPSGQGTSHLGLFGALNIAPHTPLRVTALGKKDGQVVVVGTYVVQTFPNAVTALSLRGRRPWQ
jgi:hypothetical protein